MSERITIQRATQQPDMSPTQPADRFRRRPESSKTPPSHRSATRTAPTSSPGDPSGGAPAAGRPGHELSNIPLWPNGGGSSAQPLQRKAGGSPIPTPLLAPMERAFDADFSDVRLHTGAEAGRMGDAIDARAFTRGEDIFFNRRLHPESGEGRELLAHELTHVVQNRKSGGRHGGREVSRSSDASEREARENARHVTAGRRAAVRAMPGALVQRGEKENQELLESFLKYIATEYPKETFIKAMLELHPKAGKWPSVQQGAEALYDERYAEIIGAAKSLSPQLETSDYKAQLGRYAQRARKLLQQTATQQGEYVTTNADDSKELPLKLPGEEEDVVGHFKKFAEAAKIKDVKREPGSNIDNESLANLLTNYIVAGELLPNREIHRVAPIGVKKSESKWNKNNLFTPDEPVYGHVVFTLHEDGILWVKVLQDQEIEHAKRIPNTEAYGKDDEVEKVEMLKQRIAEDFSLMDIIEKPPAKWTVQELEKLHGALSRVPGNDRSAIKGLRFIRVKALDEKEPTGRTLGAFVTDPDERRILLADGTFDRDLHSFVGSGRGAKAAPVSYQTILHEVAHAVASEQMLDALSELKSFDNRLNNEEQRLKELEKKKPTPQVGLFEDDEESRESDLKFEAIKLKISQGDALANSLKQALGGAKILPEQQFVGGLIDWFSAIGNALDASTEENIQSMNEAKKKIAALWKAVENEQPYMGVIEEVKKYADDARKIIKAQYELQEKQEEIAKKKEERARKRKEDEEAQQNHEEQAAPIREKVKALREKRDLSLEKYKESTWGEKKGYSKRVENFVVFVEKAGLAPKLTAYARHSWSEGNPEEFYAEAYSLWLNDPDYMRENLLPLYLWFQKELHKG